MPSRLESEQFERLRFAISVWGALAAFQTASDTYAYFSSVRADEYVDPVQILQSLNLATTRGISFLPPVHKEERRIWVQGSAGGIIGSLVGASSRSFDDYSQRYRGRGVGNDFLFASKRNAPGRQSWILKQVEHSWSALYNLRPQLNIGVLEVSGPVQPHQLEMETRWADAIYHDALLQALIRSKSGADGVSVEATFTKTLRGRSHAEPRPG